MSRIRLPVILSFLLLLAAAPASVASVDRLIADANTAMLSDDLKARNIGVSVAILARSMPVGRDRQLALAKAYWVQAEADARLGNTATGLTELAIARESLTKAAINGAPIEGDIRLTQGFLAQQAGDVAQALSEYQQSYRLFVANSDSKKAAWSLMLLAGLYADANDFSNSLKYLDQAASSYRGDEKMQFSIYNNRASLLQELGRYAEAEDNYHEALATARALKSDLLRVRVVANMARVELKAGQLAAAQAHVGEAMALSGAGEAAAWRPQVLVVAAQAALAAHDPVRARRLIEQRFAGVDPATTTQPFREAHQTAYDTYRALGENDAALVHLAALKRLDDQATRIATQATAALATAKFDFANQELRIASLQRDEATRKAAFEYARARTQRQMFVGSSIGLSMLIGVLAFALVVSRRARRQVEAANDDLAVTNGALGKALAAKTEFLAVTSHEIRTPLNGILGMTQVMLADRSLPADTRDRLGVVHGAGVTMRALVDDILDVAKMETGKLTIEHIAFDLCDVLRDATRMWEEQARAKGLAFEASLAACPSRVVGDPARLRQIVFNLLSNAVKFTAEGAIRVRLTHDGARAVIAVSDSGIGISADQRDTIFESFRQADAGTTRQFGGTGLGLAICRNLARAMGGEVTVDSVPGKGATFTVDLPLAPAVEDVVAERPFSSGHRSIAVVDRNPISRAMLRTMFQPRVDRVEAVATLADLPDRGAALILMDQNAAQEAAEIEALRRAATEARVVLLWAGEVPRAIGALGDIEIVAKPVAGPALAARIEALLQSPALVSEAA